MCYTTKTLCARGGAVFRRVFLKSVVLWEVSHVNVTEGILLPSINISNRGLLVSRAQRIKVFMYFTTNVSAMSFAKLVGVVVSLEIQFSADTNMVWIKCPTYYFYCKVISASSVECEVLT